MIKYRKTMPPLDTDVLARMQQFPRISLANLPTPLEQMKRLGNKINCPGLWIKRDDLTGLALGGNKTRKLEWIMADALAKGCDTIVTWGGWQSNWCRQVAAASAVLGVRAHLLLFDSPGHSGGWSGNALLDKLFGAELEKVALPISGKFFHMADLGGVLTACVQRLRDQGKRPYVVGVGGSMVEGSMTEPLGALAYLWAMLELWEQSRSLGLHWRQIVVTCGSASTQAGLLVGTLLLMPGTRVLGISVTLKADEMKSYVTSLAERLMASLQINQHIPTDSVIVDDCFQGNGYGVLDEMSLAAVKDFAAFEGILLDPVYTGKGARGMIELINRNEIACTGNTLFWHTGGAPALFSYGDDLIQS